MADTTIRPGRYSRHGMIHRSEYGIWYQMIQRCTNPRTLNFERYGGRGITVCERWRVFVNFFADMGERPSPQHSIDRIDNNGNYEPGNVRWASTKQQSLNSSRNVWLTHDGETRTVCQWAAHIGINKETLRERLQRGWSVDRALTDKPHAATERRQRSIKRWGPKRPGLLG